MSLFSWLPWARKTAPKQPVRLPQRSAARPRPPAGRTQVAAAVRVAPTELPDDLGDESVVPDDGATKFLSPKAMVEVLVDELLRGASITREERSVRLQSVPAAGQEDTGREDDRFVLLVKLKRTRADVWDYLPALGRRLIREINSRLGVEVTQVYWTAAASASPHKKLPPEWETAMRGGHSAHVDD